MTGTQEREFTASELALGELLFASLEHYDPQEDRGWQDLDPGEQAIYVFAAQRALALGRKEIEAYWRERAPK